MQNEVGFFVNQADTMQVIHWVLSMIIAALTNADIAGNLQSLVCKVRSLGIGTLFYSVWIEKCSSTKWTHFSCLKSYCTFIFFPPFSFCLKHGAFCTEFNLLFQFMFWLPSIKVCLFSFFQFIFWHKFTAQCGDILVKTNVQYYNKTYFSSKMTNYGSSKPVPPAFLYITIISNPCFKF